MQSLATLTTKVPTTWGDILPGDIIDLYLITRVQRNKAGDCVRAYFYRGGGWSAWQPATRPISVYR